MELWLYKNNTDQRYLYKKLTKIGGTITTFYFKDETELFNPTIILDDMPQNVNYCWIGTINRYYYITNIEYKEGMFYLTLHEDVLMTHQNIIKNLRVIAKRSTNCYDKFLPDERMKKEQFTHDTYKGFTGQNAFSRTANNFLLAVMGTGSTEEENENS